MVVSVAVEEGVRQIYTYYAVDESRQPVTNGNDSYDFDVTNAIEGLWETTPEKCYISAKKTGGVAVIDIPWSSVTHVKLLNAELNG